MLSDVTIALKVNQRLDEAVDLAGESIRVDARSGAVTLAGYVETDLKKMRAADIAAAVDKVREVTNLLVVNPDQVGANRAHVNTILQSISTIIGMENEEIRISVVDETARLSGQVDAFWKKEKAAVVVAQHGVLKIANDITVESLIV